ncbi:transglutaminase-like domain-containing protein [Paenibacillus apiarius]|uniref:Transglutaminase domain-containing protein n=1 Tax=Paenibacillus apiarius TaxID=46240 RepID=A0ABT4DZI7_9BACL|nr:transglutaminase domain-containing protein [Paenibacillus apiarius]MCY9515153.1 transglutaminase domain-containing protein [Paenibacillus apiarius]MCY9522746.1 transglutaminase domain-containing protein [Paenibacillus apiarius]MCY9552966.1 transglutaminase domain-containing protein [Paenibacillus apiarius]MCY9557617.1 transglutaminase domain-containing protein [Paenibacillus apiarius]MCY9681856.1 transglutaminase domain-containing protein [Paenibacillus apiarius]
MRTPNMRQLSRGNGLQAGRTAVAQLEPVRNGMPLWKRAGFSVLLYALFAEWFYPLHQLSQQIDLNDIRPFLWAIAVYLGIGLVIRSTAASLIWRGAVAVGVTAWMFGSVRHSFEADSASGAFFSFSAIMPEGLSLMASALSSDVSLWLEGKWLSTSGETRTLLLLIGWAMLTASIQSLLLSRRTVLFFSVATLCYLCGFQWGFGMDAAVPIVRVAGWSLLLSAWLHLDERLALETERRERGQGSRSFQWLLSSLLAAAAVVGIGVGLLNAYDWTNPRPLPSLQEWTQSLTASYGSSFDYSGQTAAYAVDKGKSSSANSQSGLTGYSRDDTQLGGPIRDDSRLLFKAASPEPTYWRGESKSVYTGQGWTSKPEQAETLDASGALRDDSSAALKGWSEPITQTITESRFMPELPLLFGGRAERLLSWSASGSAPDLPQSLPALRYLPGGERYDAASSGKAASITYQYETRVFRLDEEMLRTVSESSASGETQLPQEVERVELQLPANLPGRVRELGARLTAGADTQYDKVLRIQQFLLREYTYTKTDTSVPPEGRDFVDHFLFDARQGYCNHFSTAMAILLRTQGIPARWVKGFSPGEAQSPGHYAVRASDAHAWVEVYFPTVGWVPFEATPSIGLTGGAGTGTADAVLHSFAQAWTESEEGGNESHEALLTYDTPADVKELLEQSLQPQAPLTGWERVRHAGSVAAQAWRNGVEAVGKHFVSEWETLTRLGSEWKRLATGEEGLSALGAFLRYLITRMPILIILGVWIIALLLFLSAKRWRKVAPQLRLRRLVRAQERRFQSERVQEMGRIAWQLIERKYGERPCGMTWSDYLTMKRNSLSEPDPMNSTPLEQFIADCNALIFAGPQGERAVRQRFLEGCAFVLHQCT